MGSAGAQLSMPGTDLQMVVASGLVIGGNACGSQTVSGVEADHSNNVGGVVSLIATRNLASVLFTSLASTFNALGVQTDDGVQIHIDVTTDVGGLFMNGDYDKTIDSDDAVSFTDLRTVSAESILTLESKSGRVLASGDVTLNGGMGIMLLDDVDNRLNNKVLVINADFESAGDGTLTLIASKSLTSNDSKILLTAWDLDLAGTVLAGIDTINIYGALTSQTIGIGVVAKDMHIEDSELGRIACTGGLLIGGGTSMDSTGGWHLLDTANSGSIHVGGISDRSSD
jgi:hypothetical protein